MISRRLKSEDNGFEWFCWKFINYYEIIFKYINLPDSMEGNFGYDVRQHKYFENYNKHKVF